MALKSLHTNWTLGSYQKDRDDEIKLSENAPLCAAARGEVAADPVIPIGIGFDLFRAYITKLLVVLFYTTLWVPLCSANGSIDQEKFKKWDSSLDQKKRCSVSSQVENNDCINHEYKISDAELNRLYKLLINDLVNPEPLKKSQLAWIQFRDKTCAYEISGLSEGGSMPFYEKTACLINLTEKRILDLKVYSTWTYDGSPPRKH